MSRRSEWAKARDTMTKFYTKPKGVEGREKVPQICCGKCKNFSERAYASDGTGFCGVLKEGSNIEVDPPVYVTEGMAAQMVVFNMDASKCKYYQEMELIDTDITECADPAFRRSQRQLEKVIKK